MFNLKKYSQTLNDVAHDVDESVGEATDALDWDQKPIDPAKQVDLDKKVPGANFTEEEQSILDDSTIVGYVNSLRHKMEQMFGPIDNTTWEGIVQRMSPNTQRRVSDPALQQTMQDVNEKKLQTPAQNAMHSQQVQDALRRTEAELRRLLAIEKQKINNQKSLQITPQASRTAQVAEMLPEPPAAASRFPVEGLGDFIDKFFDDLTIWDGQGSEHDAVSNAAVTEIQRYVGEGFEQEANSALKAIQQMNGERDAEEIGCILSKVYSYWLAPSAKTQSTAEMEHNVMSESNPPKGIIKFNLSDHVLNNQGMQKTAAASRDGAAYLLYGPSEKRICPKLAAKNIGNVVSEYICRYHCLDGIVIDDNKTICGEALWRANVMDKQTREYVDRDGNITGGYIEKRFEVDHTTVPEENKMRLKPGEIRKPRPAAWGNLESRLQDMRSKEGKKRGYRPETDTSKPFNWAKDVDQNNVEQTQAERNRRETAAGHELVEVKNRDEAENSPEIKRAFNLKSYKTGSGSVDFLRQIEKAGGQIPINPELQQQLSAAQQSHWVEVKGNMVVLTDVGKRVLEGAGPAQVPGMTNVMNDQSQALQGAANQVQQGADLRTDVAKDMEKQQHNQAKWLKERQQERESGATGENLALPTSGAAQASFNMKSFKTAKVEEINVPGLRNEKANDAPLVKDTEEACPCEQKKKEKVANTIPIPNVTTDPQQAGGVIVQDDQGIISNPRMRRTRREQLEHQLDVEDTAKALAMD